LLVKQIKVIVALLALAAVVLLLRLQLGVWSIFVKPVYQDLKLHIVDAVVALVVLTVIIVVMMVPRVRSR
jgi:tellurite resistance protein TehA-like permease